MKKLFLLFAVMAMVLPGCKKIEESIDALSNRIDKLEQEAIPTIDEQISAINTTLDNLDAMDKELKGYIDGLQVTADNLQKQINDTNSKIDAIKEELQGEISTAKAEVFAELEALETELKNELATINSAIETLKAKDAELDQKIANLKTHIDTELGKTTDWVNATFATLEQYNALVSEVATIKEQIKAINQSVTDLETRLTTKINEDIASAVSTLNANIQQKVKDITDAYTNAIIIAKSDITTAYTAAIAIAISNLETSLKSWVGERLAGYYTIAEVDAKIAELQKAITDGDSALQEELNKLKSQLETAKAEFTEAYKKAIEEAINTNNGVIDTKIANEIDAVNQRIDEEVAAINAKIATLQAQVDKNTEDIAKLLARIQSVSYIPTYDDGKATVKYAGTKELSEATLDFKVSPKECVAELANVWEKAVKVESIYTQTRAVSFVDMPVQYFEADEATGVITIVASGKNLSDNFFACTQSASAALTISDGNNSVTTDYIPMVAQEVTNEIWYTSTDGNIVTPYATDVFGVNIVSNIYKNGKGVILFDAPITLIGQKAFLRCSSLTRIEIPSSVTSIGAYAFGYCTKLMSLTIPDSVTSIGNRAFYGCTILKTTTIPNSVIEIGDRAFYACRNFQSVTIPNSVTKIGTAAFSLCSSTKAFYGKFASTDNRCLIVNGTLNSFAPCGLTEYTIPDCVTEIGALSFPYCIHLQSVIIPDSVTSISEKAFLNCTSLIEVYCEALIPPKADSNMFSYFDADDNLYPIGCKIYVPALSVDAYKTANGWKGYADYIEEDTSITDKIYYTTTDNNIISKAWSFNTFGANIVSHTYTNGIGIIEFDAPVTKIYGAFDMCYTLKNIAIPSSVTSITEFAFSKCSSLASINIPNSVTEIGIYAFNECTSLTNITIPDSVTALGEGAFCGTSLTSVTIPNSVNSVGRFVFGACSLLTNFYGKFASSDNRCLIVDGKLNSFAYKGITKYTIPDSITSIGTGAFSLIDTPIEITIPQSVTSIESQAFWCCSALQIYCESTIPAKLHTIAFAKQNDGSSGNTDGPLVVAVRNGCPIYVPAESVEVYKTADGWKEYADYIEGYDF